MTSAVPDETRFAFGENWRRFLSVLDEDRIDEAVRGLRDMLGSHAVENRSFLDAGSGSGLMSLAAMRLGAACVHSFDYDQSSVACTTELRARYFPGTTTWTIEQGDVLDREFLESLGKWDIVYSWGVLHHTGDMWAAIDNAAARVADGGTLFIAIYNDQGMRSRYWRRVKQAYNQGPWQRVLIAGIHIPYMVVKGLAADLVRLRNPARRYTEYRRSRGMSVVHDWIDWLGGYPYEVATPEEVLGFAGARGFVPQRVVTRLHGWGCNEYVLVKSGAAPGT